MDSHKWSMVQLEHRTSQVDLMFIDDTSIVTNCEVLAPVADHCPTVLDLRLSVDSFSSNSSSWNYRAADFEGLRQHLSLEDRSPIVTSCDVETAVSLWEKKMYSAM